MELRLSLLFIGEVNAYFFLKKNPLKRGVVAYAYNFSTQKTRAGGLL